MIIRVKCGLCPRWFDSDIRRGRPAISVCPQCAKRANEKILNKEQNNGKTILLNR